MQIDLVITLATTNTLIEAKNTGGLTKKRSSSTRRKKEAYLHADDLQSPKQRTN
jgi:hypothetical protein